MSFLQSLCRHLKFYSVRSAASNSGKLLNATQDNLVPQSRDLNTGGISIFFRATSVLSSVIGAPVNQPGIVRDVGLLNRVSNNVIATFVPTRGMRIKGRVKRRCKDCELVWQDGILYNFCKTSPRHKQKMKPRYWQNERILTHFQNTPKRPW